MLLKSLQWLGFNGGGFIIFRPKVQNLFWVIFVTKNLVTNEKSIFNKNDISISNLSLKFWNEILVFCGIFQWEDLMEVSLKISNISCKKFWILSNIYHYEFNNQWNFNFKWEWKLDFKLKLKELKHIFGIVRKISNLMKSVVTMIIPKKSIG